MLPSIKTTKSKMNFIVGGIGHEMGWDSRQYAIFPNKNALTAQFPCKEPSQLLPNWKTYVTDAFFWCTYVGQRDLTSTLSSFYSNLYFFHSSSWLSLIWWTSSVLSVCSLKCPCRLLACKQPSLEKHQPAYYNILLLH